MQSPFPGMDPYIEACGLWGDFHNQLIVEIQRTLAKSAPEHYFVRTEERSYLVLVEEDEKVEHPFIPDVSVTTPPKPKRGRKKKGSAAVAESSVDSTAVTLRAFIEELHRESFVEIFESKAEQRLVTCVEVLSPSNKRPGTEGWQLYQRKRQSLMTGGVNLVEIDLLRGGTRMPMLDPWPDSTYILLVARAFQSGRCKAWPCHFQRPLPQIPVPLAKPDSDLPLDLQPLIATIYEFSRYARSIDYERPLQPPLSEDEHKWLTERLHAK